MHNIKKASFCCWLLMLIVMLSLVNCVQAGYPYFWGHASGDWSSNTIWDMGFPPLPAGHPGFGDYDYALIIGGVTITVTLDGQGQGSTDCALGYSSGNNFVNVAAGKHLQINHALDVGIGDSTSVVTGTLNLAESATAFCERLRMGLGSPACGGVINIANGATFVANSWGGDTIGETGTGVVNMRGTGSMEFRSGVCVTIGANSRIDIEKGQLKVKGDWRTKLQGYIDNGKITSFGGTLWRCTPKVTYESGWTYVKTTGGCTCESYSEVDINHDCYVDFTDFVFLAESWLDCTNPADASCSQVYLSMSDTTLSMRHYGQSIDISLNCPKFVFNIATTAEGIAPLSVVGDISSGEVVTVYYNPVGLNGLVTLESQLLLQWSPEEKIIRKWAHYRLSGNINNVVLKEIVLEKMPKSILTVEPFGYLPQSYPAFANSFFMGIEFPMASTRIEGQDLIIGHKPGLRPISSVWYDSRKAIYGAADPGKEQKAFADYITSHRVGPTGLHIDYNSWYTAPYPKYTDSDILALMQTFKDNLTTPYGVSFDSFTIDDGWANKQSIWGINTPNFPNGFTNLQNRAQSMGSSLGLWNSPSCMYPNSLDTNWAMQQGYETYQHPWVSYAFCCLAGPLYNTAYKNQLVQLATSYGVKHYKFDGFDINCHSSTHGHEPNELAAEAMAQGGINVFQAIRAASPNTWLEATCFSWGKIGSPWWLFYVNSMTGAFGDDYPIGKVPCPIYRESATTARDYYNLQGAATLPMIPISGQEVMGFNHVTAEPFLNDGVIVVTRGHGFLPVYLNPAYMNSTRWSDFAKLLTWTRNNSGTILANTYPLLPTSWQNGNQPKISDRDIMPREIYGYAHCVNNQALISLRNPWIMPQTYTIKVDESIGFNPNASGLSAVSLYPENRVYGQGLRYDSALTFTVAPYETAVLSIGSGYNLSGIPSVVNSIGGKIQANVTQSSATTDLTVTLQATVDSNAPQTKLLICMEGTYDNTTALATPTYQLLVNGSPANVQVISSEDGWRSTGMSAWEHWKFLQVTLNSAHSEISLQQLQPDAKCMKVSIWVWATKSGDGTSSFPNSLPSPELINLDAALLGEFSR